MYRRSIRERFKKFLRDYFLNPALILAAHSDNLLKAQLLLSCGADPNAKDLQGATPLAWASRYQRSNLGFVLLANGADPNCKSTDPGWTVLMQSAHYGNYQMVHALISKGAEVDQRIEMDRCPPSATALIYAIQEAVRWGYKKADYLRVINVLLAAGADPNQQESLTGETALVNYPSLKGEAIRSLS